MTSRVPNVSLLDALDRADLFAPFFPSPAWDA
jgi:hypothetical protein